MSGLPQFTNASLRATTDGEQQSVFPVTAITSTVARDGAIILATAIEPDLPIFMRNPCVLAHHPWTFDQRPGASVVLGHVLDGGVRVVPDTDDGGGYVEMDLQLAEDINPEAKLTADLIRNKDIRAVSIGWLDKGSVTLSSPKDRVAALPRFAREALTSGACNRVYTRVEVFEISVVYGAGSDRDALIQLRALWDARNRKEADMPAPTQEGNRAEVAGLAHARTGHPATNDAMYRLRGAYESLSSGYCYYDSDPNDDPPAPDVCRGVAAILREVADAVEAIASVPDTDADPVAHATTAGLSRAGKTLSADTRGILQGILDKHKEGARCHSAAMRDMSQLLDTADEDGADDDGTSLGQDIDEDSDDGADRAISELVKAVFNQE